MLRTHSALVATCQHYFIPFEFIKGYEELVYHQLATISKVSPNYVKSVAKLVYLAGKDLGRLRIAHSLVSRSGYPLYELRGHIGQMAGTVFEMNTESVAIFEAMRMYRFAEAISDADLP